MRGKSAPRLRVANLEERAPVLILDLLEDEAVVVYDVALYFAPTRESMLFGGKGRHHFVKMTMPTSLSRDMLLKEAGVNDPDVAFLWYARYAYRKFGPIRDSSAEMIAVRSRCRV